MTPGTSRNYTIINHEARISLNLSIIEYCIFDLIHHLATHPKNTQIGWCYAKKETIAAYFAVGRMTVFRAIKKGLAQGLLEKHPEQPALLRSTRRWYTTVQRQHEYQNGTPGTKVRSATYQNDTPSNTRLVRNNNRDNNNDNTVEAVKKPAKVGDILSQYCFPKKERSIVAAWQAEAKRLWNALRLAGEPSARFFKHIKIAYLKKQQQKLLIALSYCQDAKRVHDKEKLFYWRCFHDPHSKKTQTNILSTIINSIGIAGVL
jgi:hypothetical protein